MKAKIIRIKFDNFNLKINDVTIVTLKSYNCCLI